MKFLSPYKSITVLLGVGCLLGALSAGGSVGALAKEEGLPHIVVRAEDPLAAVEALEGRCGIEDARENFEFHIAAPVAYGTVYRFRAKGGNADVLTLSADREGNLLSVNMAEEAPEEAGAVKSCDLLVNSRQTDALGNEVELPIEFDGGVYSLSDELRNLYVFDMNNGTNLLLGQLYKSDTDAFSDPLAVSAYASVIKAYDFYADADNIGVSYCGIDGKNDGVAGNASQRGELSVYVLVHYSQNYMNANYTFYPTERAALLCIGDGRMGGELFLQARATDVIAHEYQHAITQFTVGLSYLNESGALNEAFSDIFGALIEGHDPSEEAFWTTGENAVPEGEGYLRSAIRPNDTTRFNYQNKYPLCHRAHSHTDCDSGGVHYNSGIATHLQYDLWRLMPDFFTRQRIGTLWFSTLNALTSGATFSEFGRELRNAAEHLGYPDEVLSLIDECLFASGITAKGNFHIVTFRDANGSLLDEVCVRDGTAPIPPAVPAKESSPLYDFVFTGWSEDLSHVTKDVTVTAQYEPALRTYPVYFLGEDGQVLKEERVPFGEGATPPDPPQKASDAQYEYVFTGWEGDYLSITEETYVSARFERKIRSYSVRFLCDGVPKQESTLEYGSKIIPPDAVPEREGYTFAGWYLDEQCTQEAEPFPTVTGDADFYAKWEKIGEEEPPALLPSEAKGCGAASPYLPLLLLLPLPFLHKKRKNEVRT